MENTAPGKPAPIPSPDAIPEDIKFEFVRTVLDDSPARFKVGDKAIDGHGDEYEITQGYCLHDVANSDGGSNHRWGYAGKRGDEEYFFRAGFLWRTDSLKPSYLRLACVNGKVMR